MPDFLSALLLVAAGLLAGSINTLSGGGTLIALPALNLLSLTLPEANASNRVAVLLQSATGAHQMHRVFPYPWRLTLALSCVAALGSVIGALLAVALDAETLRPTLAGALLFALALMLIKPEKFLKKIENPPQPSLKKGLLLFPALLLVGFYAGLAQAGVGVLFSLTLVLLGQWDLMAASSAKNLIVFVCTLPATLTFYLSSLIVWPPALILAAASALGAFLTARYLTKLPHIRPITLGLTAFTVLAASTKLLFF